MKRTAVLCLMFFAVLLLGGCVEGSIDELYALPQAQVEYKQLQTLIDGEIAQGSEYSAPTAGTSRQSVQLVDLDANGVEEALVFLKNSVSVPVICVYRLFGGSYALVSTITGEGAAIGRVEYADLDGDGILEIVVAWKMNNDMTTVTAYSMRDWAAAVLLSASGTDFRISGFRAHESVGASVGSEVAVLNMGGEGGSFVDLYFVDAQGEIDGVSARLSASMVTADRFRVSAIADGVPAAFVEGRYEAEDLGVYYLTDVLVFSGGRLQNITLDSRTGDSVAKRKTQIYSQDIDGNGSLDVPFAEAVYKQAKVSNDYYVFDWVAFSADGQGSVCASTYHTTSDGWYYVIPEEWRASFTVRRETGDTGERVVVLSTVDLEIAKVTDRLSIFTLSDENRNDRAKMPGRFVLAFSETTVFAARLEGAGGASPGEEQKNEVIGRFHIITSEWTTGAV